MNKKISDHEEMEVVEKKAQRCYYFPTKRNGMTIWADSLEEAEAKLKEMIGSVENTEAVEQNEQKEINNN
ncbi:hypothetical protein A2245_03545 [candidate division WWE3 bacterium RIFOXYA2_FULL_43_12]|nr:MAG: hypothetical protein A2245_03545 [candidate division WWE3 bacterium RIFOXYA2_FULL_43_12]